MPSKTTLKRYEMQDYVKAGNATIGKMTKRYGFTGLRHLARQVRYGRYVIPGVQRDAIPRIDAAADIQLAKRLEKMPPNTKVVCETAPPRAKPFTKTKAIKEGARISVADAPPPHAPDAANLAPEASDLAEPPKRVKTTVNRKIRDTKLALEVKLRHQYKCQVKGCRHNIKLPDGSYYAEAHHLQPLGGDHEGHDLAENILCVCPHHHAELDMAVFKLSQKKLCEVPDHRIAQNYIDYHNQIVQKRWP